MKNENATKYLNTIPGKSNYSKRGSMLILETRFDIKLKNISIHNVNITLRGGDILGLVGRSGSGKSTILKSIIGALNYQGKVQLCDDAKTVDIRDFLGYSQQENALYDMLTLEENIRIYGELYDVKKQVIAERMKILLSRLGLNGNEKKLVKEFSGGMKKRADLAVALIHDPKVLVLDEPFNGLDISLQQFIWTFIKELSSKGYIVIITSHILEHLKKNCTQFGLIENGYYYDTSQIYAYLKKGKEKSLEIFLQNIFSRDPK